MPKPKCNLGILVSGRGSNMLAIVRALEQKRVRGAEVRVVVSDKRDAKALETARKHGVHAVWVDPSESATRQHYDDRLMEVLLENQVDNTSGLVLLAGYMRLLTPSFVEYFAGRIMNIHPALLPSFPGLRAQEQALAKGVKVSGCTVHFVVPEVDSGPIILQRAVPVEEGDTAEALSARILAQEHKVYPEAVRLFVEGRLKIEGNKVAILKR
ncbi:MAG TPA: phosphoribosylglycinamide formyltransferase [Nitrososphaerales archaeon]|nr:phosphoribosylglycinamide formyltransferase [Nitrososphaerales archaeon]HUK75061.1 phosphoribosylglycinamide formyltransferase [Nitrososphaerales archaeon]